MPQAIVLDDNLANVNILRQLLEMEGLQAATFTDTASLIEHMDTLTRVQVVFLDLELPKVNGFDVLARLKAHANFQGIPVIAYTVYTNEIDVAKEEGFDGFIGKPLNIEEFPEQLRRILRGESVWYIP